MGKLPVLSVPKTKLEQWHDMISLLVLIFSTVYMFVKWSQLPQTIALHFNGQGEPDGWGSKTYLLLIPLISVILYAALTTLRRYPHKFNYVKPITEKNAADQYKIALLLLSWIKVEIVVLFGYMEWAVIQNTTGHSSGFGFWLLPVIIVTILGTVISHAVWLMKKSYE